jgi:hypothetical protein
MMKTLQIAFDDQLHSRAKAAAHTAKTTLGDLVRSAVEAHVRRVEGGESGEIVGRSATDAVAKTGADK